MSAPRVADDALRLRALDVLGPMGHPIAREALEQGAVAVEHDALAWQGSHGEMHGHRVLLEIPPSVFARAAGNHAVIDALTAAFAAAIAERKGHTLADLRIEEGSPRMISKTPYRDPR